MTEEHKENAVRLLDIVYDLYSNNKDDPYETLPFSVSDNGEIVLCDELMTELNKDGNSDLIDWAHQNIMGLFE
jgi:hypothetical protein